MIKETVIGNFNHDVLADVLASFRDFFLSRFKIVNLSMGQVYAISLNTCDVNACELLTYLLIGDSFTSYAFCLITRSLRAAFDIAELVVARYEVRDFGSRTTIEHVNVDDKNFSACAVSVPFTPFSSRVAL